MTTVILAIFFGAVQGITEFLPISSSGHLVVLHRIAPSFVAADSLGFDVALHVGTMVALVVFYFRDIIWLVRSIPEALTKRVRSGTSASLVRVIVIGTIPAAAIGFLFAEVITKTFRDVIWVATALIVVGVLMIIVERLIRVRKPVGVFSWLDGLVIGIAQAVALIPGVSRSGSTILAGRALGFRHVDAARFSFLLSVPIVVVVATKELFDLLQAGVSSAPWLPMIIGLCSSAVVGLLALRLLMRFFQSHSLTSFAVYRIALGIILLLIF